MTTTPAASLEVTPTLTLADTDVIIKQVLEKDVKVKHEIQSFQSQSGAERQGVQQQNRVRKIFILAILCLAQFFDIFSSVEAVIALPLSFLKYVSFALILIHFSRLVMLFTSH